MIEHRSLRQFLNIFCMNALLSLLIASWTKESSETNPFGERSVFEVKLSRNAMIVSDS